MSRRYTYTRTIDTPQGKESFTAVEFDSFDEAIKAVDKGIYDRKLELGFKEKVTHDNGSVEFRNIPPPVEEQDKNERGAANPNISRPLPKK
jgi:hypothetical protein